MGDKSKQAPFPTGPLLSTGPPSAQNYPYSPNAPRARSATNTSTVSATTNTSSSSSGTTSLGTSGPSSSSGGGASSSSLGTSAPSLGVPPLTPRLAPRLGAASSRLGGPPRPPPPPNQDPIPNYTSFTAMKKPIARKAQDTEPTPNYSSFTAVKKPLGKKGEGKDVGASTKSLAGMLRSASRKGTGAAGDPSAAQAGMAPTLDTSVAGVSPPMPTSAASQSSSSAYTPLSVSSQSPPSAYTYSAFGSPPSVTSHPPPTRALPDPPPSAYTASSDGGHVGGPPSTDSHGRVEGHARTLSDAGQATRDVDVPGEANTGPEALMTAKALKHQPQKREVPYPRSYEREVLDLDVWDTLFCQQLSGGSVTWHVFGEGVGGDTASPFKTDTRTARPPSKVLDLGCGTGTWILNCARAWKDAHFVGLDIVPPRESPLHARAVERVAKPATRPHEPSSRPSDSAPRQNQPALRTPERPSRASERVTRASEPSLRPPTTRPPERITWVQANFLARLPFPNDEFDFVHAKRIARGVPEDRWDALLEEIARVMKPGGAFEMIEEDLFFPGKQPEEGSSAESEQNGSGEEDAEGLEDELPDDGDETSVNTVDEERQSWDGEELTWARDSSAWDDDAWSADVEQPVRSVEQRWQPRQRDVSPFAGQAGRRSMEQPTGWQSSPFQQPKLPLRPQLSMDLRHYASQDMRRRASLDTLAMSVDIPPNPRDHSVLEHIYNEMHAARFVNLAPLSLLANTLRLHFEDVRSHPPLEFSFPPKPPPPAYSDDGELEDDDLLSDSEDEEELHPPEGLYVPRLPRVEEEKHIRAPVEKHILTTKNIVRHDTELVTFDDSRFISFSGAQRQNIFRVDEDALSVNESVFSLLHGNADPKAYPNLNLHLDVRSLNLHLALRAAEVRACAEPMWEWVLDYQARRRAMQRQRSRGSLLDIARHGAPVEKEVAGLAREDFDELLARFDMDMRDRCCLGYAIDTRFGWPASAGAPSPERKAFDMACERYDKWRAQQDQKEAQQSEREETARHEQWERARMSMPSRKGSMSKILEGLQRSSSTREPARSSGASREPRVSGTSSTGEGKQKRQLSRALCVFVGWKGGD